MADVCEQTPINNPTFIKNPVKQVTPEEAARMKWPPGGPGRPCQCRKFLCGKNIDICPSKKKYIPPKRVRPIYPQEKLCLPNVPFGETTIYRGSYFPNDGVKAALAPPKNQLCFSSGPMENRTIQKLSFPGWYDVKAAEIILPCDRQWWHGPLQDITTQKHDYVMKPFSKRCLLRSPGNLTLGSGRLQSLTTNRASYQVLPIGKTDKIVPQGNLCYSNCPMERNTVQRLSYQPNDVPEREYLPWADRGQYRPPVQRVEDNTIYRMSFEAPGEVVDDEMGDCVCKMGGCYCEYPGQCFGLPDPRPTLFPKAAC